MTLNPYASVPKPAIMRPTSRNGCKLEQLIHFETLEEYFLEESRVLLCLAILWDWHFALKGV